MCQPDIDTFHARRLKWFPAARLNLWSPASYRVAFIFSNVNLCGHIWEPQPLCFRKQITPSRGETWFVYGEVMLREGGGGTRANHANKLWRKEDDGDNNDKKKRVSFRVRSGRNWTKTIATNNRGAGYSAHWRLELPEFSLKCRPRECKSARFLWRQR